MPWAGRPSSHGPLAHVRPPLPRKGGPSALSKSGLGAHARFDSFRVHEAIELTGRIRGGDGATMRRRTDALIEALDIGKWRNTMGQQLSGGVKRLVGVAMVTVQPGRVVILDEPTNDVDPLRRRLWDQIRGLGERGCAMFLVTHNVMEAERSVDRLAIIAAGRLIAEGTPGSLKVQDHGQLRLQVMLVPGMDTPMLPGWVRHHTGSATI
jgi:ABC-2 type transport system ATP-binding protein